jgi:hypothetical protein
LFLQLTALIVYVQQRVPLADQADTEALAINVSLFLWLLVLFLKLDGTLSHRR